MQFLAAKKRDPKADTSAWEREIDQRVYQLYDLTPEEIQELWKPGSKLPDIFVASPKKPNFKLKNEPNGPDEDYARHLETRFPEVLRLILSKGRASSLRRSGRCVILLAGGNKMSARTWAVIHKEQDLYVAECPEIGTVSQGYTIEEAVANLKEATELS